MGFTKADQHAAIQMLPGVTRRLISAGGRSMAVRVVLAKGSIVPLHSHPHEQIGFVAQGRMRITVAGETALLDAGDGYSIPSNVTHSVEVPEDTVAVDIFSPVREEYLS